jgi:hypothetical protein
MNNERNKKIEQILESLDANQRATAPEFFYTRLIARMERELALEKRHTKTWLLRPAYALAALVLVLVINITVILKEEPVTESSPNSDTETAQSIAAEYSLNENNTLYDLTLENK